MTSVLITGGAGFIGSHLADQLLQVGHRVRALDNLSEQVHGPARRRPAYLADEVELQVGDVRDPGAVRRALQGVEVVYHLAAAVGVGQSMYQVAEYTSVNNLGTAVLLEALAERPVRRLVVASSMSLYGEGPYRARDGTVVAHAQRTPEQLRRGEWELCDAAGVPLEPLPTPESHAPSIASVYALSKYDQEQLCLVVGRAYGMEVVALRFFNVYGERQALANPYTGALAIFATRLLNGRAPILFEDGGQQRDFVSVHDVARAAVLALDAPAAAGQVLNIGSGHPATIATLARKAAEALGRADIAPEVPGEFRAGDIRHCFADIGRARAVLGYAPTVVLDDGIRAMTGWLHAQAAVDNVPAAMAELTRRGLAVAGHR